MSETHEVRSLAIVPKTITECTALAEVLAKSELLPKALRGKVPDVLMTIMAGQEMGLTPMASLRNFHVIEGKPVMGADGMVALVMGSGKAVYFDRIEESDKSVTYETLRAGSKTPRRCTWTLDMAKVAGVHLKDNWRAYPRAMLAARAKSELARDVYPDVLAGCYTQEEAETWNGEHPAYVPPVDAIDAEVVNDTSESLRTALDLIDRAESVESLKGLAKQIKDLKLAGAAKDDANAAYQKKMGDLRAAGSASSGVTNAEPAA